MAFDDGDRSFDHMLGTLEVAPRIDGLRGSEGKLDTTNEPASLQTSVPIRIAFSSCPLAILKWRSRRPGEDERRELAAKLRPLSVSRAGPDAASRNL